MKKIVKEVKVTFNIDFENGFYSQFWEVEEREEGESNWTSYVDEMYDFDPENGWLTDFDFDWLSEIIDYGLEEAKCEYVIISLDANSLLAEPAKEALEDFTKAVEEKDHIKLELA